MKKEQITRQLLAIKNEIGLRWDDDKIASQVKENTFEAKFAHYFFSESIKIETHIVMKKISVENGPDAQ